jgi:hypothetical protein
MFGHKREKTMTNTYTPEPALTVAELIEKLKQLPQDLPCKGTHDIACFPIIGADVDSDEDGKFAHIWVDC